MNRNPGFGYAITPSNSADLLPTPSAIFVGGAGDVVLVPAEVDVGSAVTLAAVAAGTLLPIRVRRVLSSGTTAGSLVALA